MRVLAFGSAPPSGLQRRQHPEATCRGRNPRRLGVVPLVSRKLVTAVAVIGTVLPVTIAWGATDFSYGGTPRYLAGMAQTPGAAYRNYNRISGKANEAKYLCYGPVGNGACYAGAFIAGNSTFVNLGTSGSFGYGTA